uniref:NADH dehydrogenase subunit 5 n=1 Tax=Parascaphoidella transversa TaxID=2914186 RepID=UPI001EDF9D39|nr:NADH dehydrogenase subunit 5 [Parascaphoidella transversa]UKE80333.1 NADH dehydrogenase subunit 5 [Parascaphoidella transversa]
MLNMYYIWFIIMLIFSFIFLYVSMSFLVWNSSMLLEWLLYEGNSFSLNYIIYLDWFSLCFVFVVMFISSMVILYSSVYMGSYNYSSVRFLFLVLLFVFSMLLMILSPNILSIMLGWDGLGLVSYCLVIYYSSLKSYLAGMITCLINRLGDIGLLISIAWMFNYGSWNFIFYLDFFSENIFYMVIISSFTKSAQIPFSSWLPAAMAAPTPVSSLVHSSTLVTAGVYLLIRFFNYSYFMNNFLLFISLMTMIMSSFCANYEFDLKKIIALSTLSQLGLMMSCLFLGLVDLSFFHLLSHAMFKSLLFLCSGIIIHLMGGYQDIRVMGSICLVMPVTCCCFNISNMALCGIPFLSGFYSKDLIVELSMFNSLSMIMFILFYFGLGLTALYSIRLFYYSILKGFSYMSYLSLGEDISYMKYSIMMLSFFSITFGCLFMWVMNLDMSFLVFPLYVKVLTVLIVALGLYIGYELNFVKDFMVLTYYILNGSMWFMYSYSYTSFFMSFMLGKNLNYSMLWGEYFGGLGTSYYLMKLSNSMQVYSLNSLKVFFITMIFWMVMFT